MLIEHEIELIVNQFAYQMDNNWRCITRSKRLFKAGMRGKLLRCSKSGYEAIELPEFYYIEQPWNDDEFCVFRKLTPLEVLAEIAE